MQPRMRKYQLTDAETRAVLESVGTGVIATIDPDGAPYTTPIHYIVLDGRIFFHGRKQGDKVSNIERDPRCSLSVMRMGEFERSGESACDTNTLYDSVIVKGSVARIEDPDEKMRILRAIARTLTPVRGEDPLDPKMANATAVFEIVPRETTGKCYRADPGKELFRGARPVRTDRTRPGVGTVIPAPRHPDPHAAQHAEVPAVRGRDQTGPREYRHRGHRHRVP